MLKSISISPVVRAVLVIGAVAALVTGVTFAALDSEATLTNNTLASETTDLVIDGDGDNNFDESEDGFDFAGIIPGSASSQTESFKLRNQGTVALDVKAAVTGTPALVPADVDQTKVHFFFDNVAGVGTDVTLTLAELSAPGGAVFLNNMAANESASVDYDVSVSVDSDAFDGETFSVSAFNLVFSGTPVVTP